MFGILTAESVDLCQTKLNKSKDFQLIGLASLTGQPPKMWTLPVITRLETQ